MTGLLWALSRCWPNDDDGTVILSVDFCVPALEYKYQVRCSLHGRDRIFPGLWKMREALTGSWKFKRAFAIVHCIL